MTNEIIRSLIDSHPHWYHQIELAPGVFTPGIHDSPNALRHLDDLGLPADCSGLRVLDVGCRDGFFAFEMERRGADVLGIDYARPETTGFEIASRVLGSAVRYEVENVYRLAPERHGTFDLILFLGVLYHLRNPMLALDALRSVQRPGGVLFVETQMATDERIGAIDLPLWQFYPKDTLQGDHSNKWAPNPAGLMAVVEESQYRVLEAMNTGSRGYVRARAVDDEQLAYFRRLDAARGLWGRSESDDGE